MQTIATMTTTARTLGKTRITTYYPWGLMHRRGSRLLCSDGKLRAPAYLASTPDTFFSTPAAVMVGGKYVTGYMTAEECFVAPDYGTERKAYVFRQHTESNAKHGNPLPEWPGSFTPELFALLEQGEEITAAL